MRPVEMNSVNNRTSFAPGFEQPGVNQGRQMRRHGVLRHVDSACNFPSRHPTGAAANQQAEGFQACSLGKRCEASGSDIHLHISRLIDIYTCNNPLTSDVYNY